MKILRKITKFMDKYGMIRALVFSLVLSFLQMFIFAHTTMTGEMLGFFPVFNVCLVLILLEIRLFIKLYVIFRFTKRKYFKILSKKKRRS
jgi:hypothetical protein